MLTHPTLDQLNQLGLPGMAQAFTELEASGDAATLGHADWLGLLLDREVTHRRDKRLAARLRYARLRHHAAVEDVDYRATRGLDRALFQRLAKGEWLDAHDNLILCGPTGVGKSWLACALGHKACRDNTDCARRSRWRAIELIRRETAGATLQSCLSFARLCDGSKNLPICELLHTSP